MTKLYVCEISNLIEEIKSDEKVLDVYFAQLGKMRIEHILKNSKAEDRARALGASLLLLFVLQEEGYRINNLPDFAFTEKGKPYIKDLEQVHFNISHTKNIITCVISSGEIGVDIEHVRDMRAATINRVFSEKEKQMAKYDTEGYIRLWTMKEACAKLIGTGLGDVLNGLEIKEDKNGKYVEKLNQDITKTSCYRIIAEGQLVDSYNYPYYYSVCAKENCTSQQYGISIMKYKWDEGRFS